MFVKGFGYVGNKPGEWSAYTDRLQSVPKAKRPKRSRCSQATALLSSLLSGGPLTWNSTCQVSIVIRHQSMCYGAGSGFDGVCVCDIELQSFDDGGEQHTAGEPAHLVECVSLIALLCYACEDADLKSRGGMVMFGC